jgi:3-deoxy-D-manno-octulosonic acid kinase
VIERGIVAQLAVVGDCIVIHDALRVPAPQVEWFDAEHWPRRELLDRGRGATFGVDLEIGEAVLRRYHRGGLVARLLKDRYIWTGMDRARPIAEFRLLAAAVEAGLPVPRPLAALVRREGSFYMGALLMERIPGAETLSARLARLRDWRDFDWDALGFLLGRTHALGFRHADLNAHNVLIDAAESLWLIDWDRGSRQAAGPWAARVLERLARSLRKLHGARAEAADAREAWQSLLRAHERASEMEAARG